MQNTTSKSTIRYDAARRRLWILGQRCHHGALGVVLTAAGGAWLLSTAIPKSAQAQLSAAAALATPGIFAIAGGVLMLHDIGDLTIWFERGAGTQP